MQQNRNNDRPQVMTWAKASPALIVGGIFDVLRYFFLCFWFFGPALAMAFCTIKISGVMETRAAGLLGAKTAFLVCGSGTAIAGYFSAPVLGAFGTVMAIAMGFLGWLTVTFMILISNRKVFGENPFSILWLLEGIGASNLIMVWGIYKNQIKKEKEFLKKRRSEQRMPDLMQPSSQ